MRLLVASILLSITAWNSALLPFLPRWKTGAVVVGKEFLLVFIVNELGSPRLLIPVSYTHLTLPTTEE